MDDSRETDRLTDTRKKVDDVREVAQQNLEKVIRRGENLDDIHDRTESLRLTAGEFNISSRRIKRKMCWQNIKLWIILLIVLLVILIVLIVALVIATQHKQQ